MACDLRNTFGAMVMFPVHYRQRMDTLQRHAIRTAWCHVARVMHNASCVLGTRNAASFDVGDTRCELWKPGNVEAWKPWTSGVSVIGCFFGSANVLNNHQI